MADIYLPIEIKEFNPADLENLVRFCVQELESRRLHQLPPIQDFDGAGIYALYYSGDFAPYQHSSIRLMETAQPIYVGRARLTKSSGRRPLFNRLKQHAKSIVAAQNLELEDFSCRFLILHPVWVSTVEDLLISHFDTLWNGVIKGFGIHDPGGKRHEGEIPIWDTLHPGRDHARKMLEKGAQAPPLSEVLEAIDAFVKRRMGHTGPAHLSQDEVRTFLMEHLLEEDELRGVDQEP